jgi:hypothetical protein
LEKVNECINAHSDIKQLDVDSDGTQLKSALTLLHSLIHFHIHLHKNFHFPVTMTDTWSQQLLDVTSTDYAISDVCDMLEKALEVSGRF